MSKLAAVLGLVLAVAQAACVEKLANSPFSGDAFFMGAMPIPNRTDVLIAFSNKGEIVKLNAQTGALLSAVGQVDLSSEGGEAGLLALAVRFDFATSGKFYTWGNTVQQFENDLALDEWTCSNPAQVSGCQRSGVVLEVYHMFSNHNGGSLMFDHLEPSILFLSVGDGGSGCDPQNSSQNPKRLLGKVLRIDVGTGSAANYNYTVPESNPLKPSKTKRVEMCGKNLARQRARTTNPCREVWVKGLRNPYRCSLDRLDPQSQFRITCGDVGQGRLEEVDLIPTRPTGRVLNYGWDVFEGNKGAVGNGCTGTKQTCPLGRIRTMQRIAYVCPIAVEAQSNGWASLIGGYVCRTCGDPQLVGKFLYADFMLEKSLRAVAVRDGLAKVSVPVKLCTNSSVCVVQANAVPLDSDWMVFSFAEDNLGRISLIHAALGMYRITNPEHCT